MLGMSDWPKMGQIQHIFRSDFSTFWLGEPKCTEISSEKVPDLSDLWPTLGSNPISLMVIYRNDRTIISHPQERPYICGNCGDTFARSQDLQLHYASHSSTSLRNVVTSATSGHPPHQQGTSSLVEANTSRQETDTPETSTDKPNDCPTSSSMDVVLGVAEATLISSRVEAVSDMEVTLNDQSTTDTHPANSKDVSKPDSQSICVDLQPSTAQATHQPPVTQPPTVCSASSSPTAASDVGDTGSQCEENLYVSAAPLFIDSRVSSPSSTTGGCNKRNSQSDEEAGYNSENAAETTDSNSQLEYQHAEEMSRQEIVLETCEEGQTSVKTVPHFEVDHCEEVEEQAVSSTYPGDGTFHLYSAGVNPLADGNLGVESSQVTERVDVVLEQMSAREEVSSEEVMDYQSDYKSESGAVENVEIVPDSENSNTNAIFLPQTYYGV